MPPISVSMTRKTSLILSVLLLLGATVPAIGAELVVLHDRDKISGVFHGPDEEIGFAVDAIAGTVLSVTVKAVPGTPLRPEIRLYDPEGFAIDIGANPLIEIGSKARLKKFVIPTTGRHTLVVRAARESSGSYRMKVRVSHPTKVKREGAVSGFAPEMLVPIPALAGTSVRAKVKGKEGLVPSVDEILTPDVRSLPLENVTADEGRVRFGPVRLEQHGDHRLAIRGADGSTGRYKCVLKLAHPTHERRKLEVHSWPAGTYLGTLHESRDQHRYEPPPPPPPFEYRRIAGGFDSDVSKTVQIVARTSEEFTDLLSCVNLETASMGVGGGTPVDFSREIVVGLFLGKRPTHGYWMVYDITKAGGGARVWWYEQTPNAVYTYPQEETRAWILVRMTRVSGPVVFERGPDLVGPVYYPL